ncbi:sacsin N-terminal ATP-binding-like domain-containing protein [Streptomyces sp. NPDC057027]|uniref:sacsin N-terminal ATP-binding-like domain-containing protein n=1 Tax=Streptomyces sp. NPDC057027 TaxID=3346004 RepID=UPI0036267803
MATRSSEAVKRAVRSADRLFAQEKTREAVAVPEPEGGAATAAAIERLGELFATLPWMVRHAFDRTRNHAGNLSSDPLQGLSEIVQNAEDLGAADVRVLTGERDLLVAHNGAPVRLPDVMALALPWLSSKEDQTEATGRFGIGLMTLQSLSPFLEVHNGHYRVRIGDPYVSVAEPLVVPRWFADDAWTVLRIPLEPGVVDAEAVDEWLDSWSSGALLFLGRVVAVTHLDAQGEVRRRLALTRESGPAFEAEIGGAPAEVETHLGRSPDGPRWLVCRATVPSPSGVDRARKAAGPTTALAVALPLGHGAPGRIHVGLPVEETGPALWANAQFDPLVSRQALDDTPWNRALVPLVADLWAAAVLHQFRHDPAHAWSAVPLPGDVRDGRDPAAALERQLLDRARRLVSAELLLDVPGKGPLALGSLAVEDAELEDVVTEEEVARLAEVAATLPGSMRDPEGRWREVLWDWEEHGAAAPARIDVLDTLDLLGDATRSPSATVRLAARVIEAGWSVFLSSHEWLVDNSGGRYRIRGAVPVVFAAAPRGLAVDLGLAREIHPAFLADTHEARSVRQWLGKQGVLLEDDEPAAVIERLSEFGATRGGSAGLPLTDDQLVALRDGFAHVPEKYREAWGGNVGLAVRLQGYRYTGDGERADVETAPARAYLPSRLDSAEREESFAFAAGPASGPVWLRPRYAEVLQGGGIGALRFLRLLGAETGPRLRRHPELERRFEGRSRGLHASVASGPTSRRKALSALGATYTLDDHDCPDLHSVASDIAKDEDSGRRRQRAAALLHVLGRTWSRFSEHAEVKAAYDYRGWHPQGRTPAFWLWQLRDVAWLDDRNGTPSRPTLLRMRTAGTVAVYGDGDPHFLHPEIQEHAGRRIEVLRALEIVGEARTKDLVDCLRRLRREEKEGADRDGPAARIVYEALAEHVTGRDVPGRVGDMPFHEVRLAFAEGEGLVLTDRGWRRPADCLLGDPLFGAVRAFAPTFTGHEPFWTRLGARRPNVEDAAAVIKELAQEDRKARRDSPEGTSQSAVLETLKLLRDLSATRPEELTAGRLGRIPLVTSKGWRSKRPVYAVEDPLVAEGLGRDHAVWRPGAELEQFRPLAGVMRLTWIGAERLTVHAPVAAYDAKATELVGAAVAHLREDLRRDAPEVARSLDRSWDELAALTVCVAPELTCQVELPDADTAVEVPVEAGVDWASGTLYVRHVSAVNRPTVVGASIAARFPGKRRESALAWAAACDRAEQGRIAVDLSLAEERVRRDEEAAAAERDRRLRDMRDEAHRRVRTGGAGGRSSAGAPSGTGTGAGAGGRPSAGAPSATGGQGPVPRGTTSGRSASVPPGPEPVTPVRRLVDPGALRLVVERGNLAAPRSSGGPATDTAPRKGGLGLPQPRSGPVVPQQRTTARPYTTVEQEKVALDLVRRALALDETELRDLRAQRGLGADAVDELARFYELKTYGPAEPDTIQLTPAEFQRARESDDFFLVIVSGLEAGTAPVQVRVILEPLKHLPYRPSGNVLVSGIRGAQSLVYPFESTEQIRP